MANQMSIVISAVDQVTKPVDRMQKKLNGISVKSAASQIEKMGAQLNKAFESPSGGISAVSSFLSTRNIMIGAIGGVIAQTMRMEAQWASSVRGMGNMATRTGLSFGTVYQTQYAGHLAGLSDEQTNAGIEQLRQTYSNALNNRDPEALKRYQAAGISTDPTHYENIESVLTKLSAYAQTLRDQGKYGGAQNFLQASGAGSLSDFLNRGPRQVAADLLEAKKYIPNDRDRQRAQEYADATARLGVTYDRLKMTILGDIEPGLNKILQGVQALFDGPVERQKLFDSAVQSANPTDARGVPIAPDESTLAGRVAAGEQRLGNFMRGRGAHTNAEIAALPGSGTSGFSGLRSGAGNVTPQTYAYFSSLEGKYGLPAGLLDSVWAEESSRGLRLRSPAGALGHFQFMPATAKQYGLQNPDSLTESADAAARYYRDLLKANNGNLPRALAAYNWGQRNVNDYGIGKAPAETRGYIADIMASMAESGRSPLIGEAPTPPAPAPAPIAGIYGRDDSAPKQQDDAEPKGRMEKLQVEIVHRNAPRGTDVNVSGAPGVDATIKSDRLPGSRGDQYAYSPGNF